MAKTTYFSTQIYGENLLRSKAENRKLAAELKKESFQIYKSDVAGQKWSEKNYPFGYTSYSSLDQLHRLSSTFITLQKKIDSHVTKYCKNLNYVLPKNSLQMTQCWVNIMPEGAQHTSHLHPLSVVSGTYYVSVPAGSSCIKFEDPRLALFMNSPPVKDNAPAEFQRFVSLKPQAGDLVLFESWLKHEVPVNQTKIPRISISFNYGWR